MVIILYKSLFIIIKGALVAIKTDLKQRRVISTKQGRDQASSKGLEYFECSAVSIIFACLFHAGFVLSLEFLKKS